MYQTLVDRGVAAVYHFTDRFNIESIIRNDGLLPLTVLRGQNIPDIRYGGNDWSHEADARKGVNQYVHLCFDTNHPMEYCARQDGRITETCWLEIDLALLNNEEVMYTADVSNKVDVPLLTADEAKEAIDLDGIYQFLDFRVEGNQERKNNAQKSEILIPHGVPLNKILNINTFRR